MTGRRDFREISCSSAGSEILYLLGSHGDWRSELKKTAASEIQANQQASALAHGAVEVISPAEFAAKVALERPLRIKLGMDPTAPDLHLGHSVTLKKLRDFQRAGHTVIFLVGDFTAMIGDPTGRSETRRPLSRDRSPRTRRPIARRHFKFSIPTALKCASTASG